MMPEKADGMEASSIGLSTSKHKALSQRISNITIYVTSTCRYSQQALTLLDNSEASYTKVVIDTIELWEELEKCTGRSTVPQIYNDDCYIGGFDELENLQKKGLLNEALKLV
jgi:glutaredoxin 3